MSLTDLAKFFAKVQEEQLTPDQLQGKIRSVIDQYGSSGNMTTGQVCI